MVRDCYFISEGLPHSNITSTLAHIHNLFSVQWLDSGPLLRKGGLCGNVWLSFVTALLMLYGQSVVGLSFVSMQKRLLFNIGSGSDGCMMPYCSETFLLSRCLTCAKQNKKNSVLIFPDQMISRPNNGTGKQEPVHCLQG